MELSEIQNLERSEITNQLNKRNFVYWSTGENGKSFNFPYKGIKTSNLACKLWLEINREESEYMELVNSAIDGYIKRNH